MAPRMLTQKWVSIQKKYGEKRKGGYIDMGKQVRVMWYISNSKISFLLQDLPPEHVYPQNHQGSR